MEILMTSATTVSSPLRLRELISTPAASGHLLTTWARTTLWLDRLYRRRTRPVSYHRSPARKSSRCDRATHPMQLNGVIVSEVSEMPTSKKKMSIVDSWSDVPKFTSEADETEWWSTHELGDGLLTQMKPVPLTPEEQTARGARTHPVAIRFDDSTLERVRALAHRRHKGYQTLLKEFVVERLYEEEKREGMLG